MRRQNGELSLRQDHPGRLAAVAVIATLIAGQAAAQQPPRSVTLEEAVRVTLSESRQMAIARLQVAEADQQVREAWGSILPRIDAVSNYTRNLSVPMQYLPAVIFGGDSEELVPVRFGADNVWYGHLRAEQPLFSAAAFIGVGAAARYRTLRSEEARGAAQRAVTQTREVYLGVLLAEEAVRLTENSLERVRLTLAETQALYRAGLVSEYDVLRLEVELANLEPRLRRARHDASAARRALAVQLGLEGGAEVGAVGELAGVNLGTGTADVLRLSGLRDPEGADPGALLELARSRRSDLLQLAAMVDLRRTHLRLEQVEYLPRVALVGTYSLSAQENDGPDFFGGREGQRIYGRQIGVQLSLPVFSGMQRPARVQQRQLGMRQAEEERRFVMAQAETEVLSLLAAVRESRERAAAQQRAVALAERGYRIAGAQLREGLGTRLEATDAELALRQSEFNYAQAIHDYLVARARLDLSVGMVPAVDG
jgi:outer membrane protein